MTRLRALLRSNEFYLIPLAMVLGAVVTLMSEIAQIAHVLIYGIPIDVRSSANSFIKPWAALVAPATWIRPGGTNKRAFHLAWWLINLRLQQREGHAGDGASMDLRPARQAVKGLGAAAMRPRISIVGEKRWT